MRLCPQWSDPALIVYLVMQIDEVALLGGVALARNGDLPVMHLKDCR
jgi:hypothetical protein